ncbi:phosphoribosylamine--glycine ligase [Robertkochia aurantiaca]|uniref:phosphoribosylamine--glycine ligase n=1 Tax=Robertkochia aurantiaca TaxID=2873700 RepID=UPI001CCC38B1|nr:phosphoribosylamine--glycine ligase [Robertkochia sp. 3YJGBD-33]
MKTKKKEPIQPTKKMNFLFVSRYGESLDLANAVQQEGHQVRMYTVERSCREIGLGFVKRTTDWKKTSDWADIVIFDYTGFGQESQWLREKGKLVFGGNAYTDQLELDRNFGHGELKKHGVKTLPSWEFKSFDDAINFIKKHPDAYVVKPSGETQEFKQLLFVGQDDEGSDVIRILRAYERSWGNNFGDFQLQKKVKGVEVSVSGFFNGDTFLKPINVTFEHKKLFPKELGVSTGEMGSSMFWTEDSPIYNATLAKFIPTLRSHGFIGHIDLNCIVNGNGIYPLEFTSRFGFPQVYIQRAGIQEPFGQMLVKVARGERFKIHTKKGFQVGAFIVVPPFPYEDKKTFQLFSKDAVVVFKKDKKDGIHPMHVKMVNDEWLITGDTGIAVMVSGTGLTMRDAQRMMQNRINNVIVNNGYYRTDIGDRWQEDSDRLWSWGLL